MKPWIYKPMLLLVLFGLMSTITYADGRKDFTKTIKKEFDITRDGEVGLSNQFGQIEVKTWDKNRVKVAITIIARTDTEKQAQTVFDRIDIDFSNGREYVKVETEIDEHRGRGWWGSSNNKYDFAINYEVFLPKTVELDLRNRHGNSYVVEMDSNGSIDVAHGNITADGFTGNLDLEVAHGNGTIVAAKNLEADVSHSNIRLKRVGNVELETAHCSVDIGEAKKIRLDSRHTNYEIGDIDELRVDTRHDVMEIESVNSIYAESGHTSFEIEKVTKVADFDCSHGGVTIDYLAKGFEEVSLMGQHAGFKIRVADDAPFSVDLSGTHAGVRYPMDMDISYEKDKNNMQEVRGSRGIAGVKGGGMIKARMSHGGIRIR